VPARPRWQVLLPWLLCAVSLMLIAVGGWPRSAAGPASGQPWAWLDTVLPGLAIAGIPVVGALLASRLPSNPYGWLWCAIGVVVSTFGSTSLVTEAIGGPRWVGAVLGGVSFAVLAPLLVLAILLFPTGRVPSPRWRWLPRTLAGGAVLLILAGPFIPAPADPATQTPWALQGAAGEFVRRAAVAWVLVMFALGLAAVWALLLRYRRAGPVERQQLKWFLYAALLAVLLLTLNAWRLLPWPLSVVLLAVSLALFPAAVLVAMLRYRLYEIDRIVSRTVSYALLTAGLIGLYLLVVGLLRPLLEPFTGSSTLAVAGSTLAVAAVFNPARRRLQGAVDRRFDRARYDAARAVDAFAARLRTQVDLDQISGGLRDTVTATVAPGRVSVWLRPGSSAPGSGRSA
jgi:hypothetical protein